jgi:hypothetical protein
VRGDQNGVDIDDSGRAAADVMVENMGLPGQRPGSRPGPPPGGDTCYWAVVSKDRNGNITHIQNRLGAARRLSRYEPARTSSRCAVGIVNLAGS